MKKCNKCHAWKFSLWFPIGLGPICNIFLLPIAAARDKCIEAEKQGGVMQILADGVTERTSREEAMALVTQTKNDTEIPVVIKNVTVKQREAIRDSRWIGAMRGYGSITRAIE